jgi:uncharacterized membrane protein YoaK (UPF0700 family)
MRSRFSPVDYMPYTLIVGVVIVSFIAMLIVGFDAWFVPLVVVPFAVLYLLFDRRMRDRTRGEGDASHGA